MKTLIEPEYDLNVLAKQFKRIRGNTELVPDASVAIPVNAQGDLQKVLGILTDLSLYKGKHSLELILVINNYPPDEPPIEKEKYSVFGKIISNPNTSRAGEAPGLSARMIGVETAKTDLVILFDADCRIVSATDLIDWYVKQFELGADHAYTHVDYYELGDHWQIRFRIRVHHFARWVKRVLLGIPTTRGSNYAVDRQLMLTSYREGFIADDLNVGRTLKAKGAKIAYSGAPNLGVVTSGRMFNAKGVFQLYRYFKYRLHYNLKVLPVRRNAQRYTGRERDPVRRYVDGKQVKNPVSVDKEQ